MTTITTIATTVLIQGRSLLMLAAHSLTPPSRPRRSSSSVSWRRSSSTFSWKPASAVTSSERGRGASTSRDRADPPGPRREQHDAVGQEHGLGDRVGDEDDGRVRGLGDPLQLQVHLVARDRVERAEGLVHEQDLGVVAQGPGDGDALAHAAGELTRERLLKALQADELAQLVGAPPALGLVDLAQQQRQADVLLDRVPGEEVGVLEDEPELAQRVVVAVVAVPERAAADRHLAVAGLRQAREDPQQRRLAAPRLPEQRDELLLADAEVDAGQREGLAACGR